MTLVPTEKGAFISRLRDSEECYFKGLWVGLIATPEEVVHDASGAKPRKTLAKLEEIVAKTVFNEDTTLSKNLAEPSEPGFKAMDLLNTSTHLTAMFLIYRSELPDADVANMYAWGLRRIQTQAAHLNYSSDELKTGKDRKDIINGLREFRKKSNSNAIHTASNLRRRRVANATQKDVRRRAAQIREGGAVHGVPDSKHGETTAARFCAAARGSSRRVAQETSMRRSAVSSMSHLLFGSEYPPAVGRVGFRGCGDGEIRSAD